VNRVLLSFGGNLGDPVSAILTAYEALQERGFHDLKRSHFYRTKPWGLTDQPDFINSCAEAVTFLSPEDVLSVMQQLEYEAGPRKPDLKWGPRVLDIDLLSYEDQVHDSPHLTLPHPHLWERAFVLVPLLDLGKDRVILGRSLREAVKNVDLTGIERLKEV
jgi:2-amino-4-hydroxy-6-hydroxymethyldihydropteridine diphosphokinase